MAFGLFVSAFAQTEFQAVQFMPAFVLPQILLCGLFVAQDQMADWLRVISYLLPLTYAFDALDRAAHEPTLGPRFWIDVSWSSARRCSRSHSAPPPSGGGRRDGPTSRPKWLRATKSFVGSRPGTTRSRRRRTP